MAFTTDATRWQAVSSRNLAADCAFVYCVKSTFIYCRPSCPARLCRRANLVYCDTPAEAEAMGFRACKRCRPDTLEPYRDLQKEMIDRACEIAKAKVKRGQRVVAKALAKEVGISESHFCRAFKKWKGCTPGEFIARARNSGEQRAGVVVGQEGSGETTRSMSRETDGFEDMSFLDENLPALDLQNPGEFVHFDEEMLDDLFGPLHEARPSFLPPASENIERDPLDEYLNLPP